MHVSVVIFGAKRLPQLGIPGAAVLEVGACDVNGSLRTLVEDLRPARYVGVDIASGPGVDQVCPSEELSQRFGPDSFDVVISTEMLEHVVDWRAVITNIKQVVRPGGRLLITTRSRNFPYHAWPVDTWRYEVEDFQRIFADFEIRTLQADPDPGRPGVFFVGVKPADWQPSELSDIALFSMMRQERIADTALALRPNGRFFPRAIKDLLLNVTLGGILRRAQRIPARLLRRRK